MKIPALRFSVEGQHFNFLVSNREGLGTSLEIMGLATIDPHSQKEHTEIHKIPKFGVNQASFHRDTAIQKRQNLQRNVFHPDAVSDSVRMATHFCKF